MPWAIWLKTYAPILDRARSRLTAALSHADTFQHYGNDIAPCSIDLDLASAHDHGRGPDWQP
jgi:hypothetical protein